MVADILGNVVPMVSMWSMTTSSHASVSSGICQDPHRDQNQGCLSHGPIVPQPVSMHSAPMDTGGCVYSTLP